MKNNLVRLLFAGIFIFSLPVHAGLEYDSAANKVEIYGPYIKYNILKPPYSLGRFSFNPEDIRVEGFANPDSENSEAEVPLELRAIWPRFLMDYGQLQILSLSGRVLLTQNFQNSDLAEDQKLAQLPLSDSSQSFIEVLKEGFQLCLSQKYKKSLVDACSSYFIYSDGKFVEKLSGKNIGSVIFNGKKHPKNAQIILSDEKKGLSLEIKFKSGFRITIQDEIRRLTMDNLLIDPKEQRIGVVDGGGQIRPTRLTTRGQIFSFMKEQNYFINDYKGQKNWSDKFEEAEMEFAPYEIGASLQLFGLVLPKIPPAFEFSLNEKSPIATYSPFVYLKGRKGPTEQLAAKEKGELLVNTNEIDFIWKFKTEKKAEVNRNYLSLQHKGDNYFFSNRIFRAHKTSVSASAALSTSPTLDIVPGYNFTFDHWFEEIWNTSSLSYQRWGIKGNIYETVKGFKPSENYPESISVLPINLDLLYRFSPGVKPVQSSFGAGLRYMRFKLFRSISSDIESELLGVGTFWHTAPQKIVDDIFNVVPFFRYPKWMELSFFYYPLIIGGETAGFSFSWQARGQMYFAKNWFLDASFNVNNIAFKRTKLEGVTVGADSFGIGTAHGTIGVGYLFN